MMNNFRRTATKSMLAMGVCAMLPAARGLMPARSNAVAAVDLAPTPLIQSRHPRIVDLAQAISKPAPTQREAAVLIHDWVRDNILFGIAPDFYEQTATEVLDAKVGYCNTKVTLFCALLRACGIAARIRMVDLSAQVLNGLFDPGTPYVDHAITELFLDGRWLMVDSYVVDAKLVAAARIKLAASSKLTGFGIHSDGNSVWNGKSDSFIQCLDNGSITSYVLREHGYFADIADFYQSVQSTRNRKTWANGLMIRLGSASVNRQISSTRAIAG